MDNLELLRRLLAHIDEQAVIIVSLEEYVAALENSLIMREMTRRFALPPPG